MAATDRAFRALAREEPASLLSLVNILFPNLLPGGPALHPLSARDPRLDTPDPSLEADAAFVEDARQLLWHFEGQGYGEENFLDRVLRYHLGFTLRFWHLEVRSVVLWLRAPSAEQRVPLRTSSPGHVVPGFPPTGNLFAGAPARPP
jgi:hypothetical protein